MEVHTRSTWLTATLLATLAGPALAGGIAIVNTVLEDNGDGDGYADTRETVTMKLTLQNTSGTPLTGVTAHLFTEDSLLACVTTSSIQVGDLAIGETRTTADGFVFTVMDVDRGMLGLGPYGELSVELEIRFEANLEAPAAIAGKQSLDLDLDVSGGAGPATFLESFEGTLGAFEVQNLDQGKSSLAASDGYRCQYSDPEAPNSNTYGEYEDVCYLGNSPLHADAIFWGLSGPAFSPLGGRGFSGFHAMFFGRDDGPPENWTTPVSTLEAASTSEPIHLDWTAAPMLSFMHQTSFVDQRSVPQLADGESYDRGVVMARLADGQDQGVGPWVKLYPYQNGYDSVNAPNVLNCMFDPTDDGNTEDDFDLPDDPGRRYGPSSTCFPEPTFVNIGETSEAFAAGNVGRADGPGMAGVWGIGTWIESRVDLGRFRGRSVFLRFLSSMAQIEQAPIETWEDLFQNNPIPGDDGWWIDDVTVTGSLTSPATVAVDTHDNAGLAIPSGDADQDGVADVCDNCAATVNSGQQDFDRDGLGNDCDPCPTNTDNTDPDLDQVCGLLDNCPFDANPGQADSDFDGAGNACDCNPLDNRIFPGAAEVNDGLDNQCPGDSGFGVIDEVTGPLLATSPAQLVWTPQAGAARYQVASASSGDFVVGCALTAPSPAVSYSDPIPVLPGEIRYYNVRAALPLVGSWGQDSTGAERDVPCD